MIERLEIENFKSFRKLDLELGRLNCFIGPNACGKSNLIDALAFLRDCVADGVDAAMEERGGPEGTVWRGRAASAAATRQVAFRVHVALTPPRRAWLLAGQPEKVPEVRALHFEYGLVARGWHRGPGVEAEDLVARWIDKQGGKGKGRIFTRSEGAVEFSPGMWAPAPLAGMLSGLGRPARDRLVLSSVFLPWCQWLSAHLEGWQFYDIAPASVRAARPRSQRSDLAPSGDNLAAALHELWTRKSREAGEAREQILASMQRAVPGFQGVETKREADDAVSLCVRERDVAGRLRAASLSDGTIRLLAYHLIAPLAARAPTLVCLEEPDRNLHPHLLEQVRDLLRTLSERTQVIVTTHSPGLVELLEPNEVFLMDKEGGRTRVMRAQEVEHIEAFLEDFTLGELWTQGAIGGVPE